MPTPDLIDAFMMPIADGVFDRSHVATAVGEIVSGAIGGRQLIDLI